MKQSLAAILIGSGLFAANAMAQGSDLYVGIDLVGSSNTFTLETLGLSADVDDDSSGFKLKFGSVLNDGWRVQGYFLHETYDRPVFDSTHDQLNEIGVDIIKGFAATPEFSPFLQAGLGYGGMKVDGYDESSINGVSLKIGGGVMYKVTPAFEILAGIDLQVRGWQDIQILGITVETSETSSKAYIGTNIHF